MRQCYLGGLAPPPLPRAADLECTVDCVPTQYKLQHQIVTGHTLIEWKTPVRGRAVGHSPHRSPLLRPLQHPLEQPVQQILRELPVVGDALVQLEVGVHHLLELILHHVIEREACILTGIRP